MISDHIHRGVDVWTNGFNVQIDLKWYVANTLIMINSKIMRACTNILSFDLIDFAYEAFNDRIVSYSNKPILFYSL